MYIFTYNIMGLYCFDSNQGGVFIARKYGDMWRVVIRYVRVNFSYLIF